MSDLKSWRDIDREYLHPGPANIVAPHPMGVGINAERAKVLRWHLAWLAIEFQRHPGFEDSDGNWSAGELVEELRALLAPIAGASRSQAEEDAETMAWVKGVRK